jgi:hypothetical protein
MTNNKQQTAVDILCGKLAMKLGIPQAITFYIDHQEEIREAKEMEKEQISKAFDDGDYNYYCSIQTGNDLDDGQEHYQEFNDGQDYYEKTYGGGEK